MFEKSTRKELSELDWVDFLKKGGNPYQKQKRITLDCQKAMRDLSLLATVVPYKDQSEIFNDGLVELLIGDLLGIRKSILPVNPVEPELDRRRAKLAAMMIEKSIGYCKFQLRRVMPETPSLTEPILKHLGETISICNDIANKVESEQLTAEARSEEDYLFSWNNVSQRDFRFNKFMRMPFSLGTGPFLDILQINKGKDGKTIHCILKSSVPEFSDKYSAHITVNDNGKGLAKFFSDGSRMKKEKEIYSLELIVKDYGDNKYIFMKKKDRKQLLV